MVSRLRGVDLPADGRKIALDALDIRVTGHAPQLLGVMLAYTPGMVILAILLFRTRVEDALDFTD